MTKKILIDEAVVKQAILTLERLGEASDTDVSPKKWYEARGWPTLEALEAVIADQKAAELSHQQDLADMIAGELQVSRGTAYELMREALEVNNKGVNALAEQAAEPVDGALDRTLKERDDAEDFIDALLDEVLGNNRPEWSSAYGRSDALNDVRERLAQQAAWLPSAEWTACVKLPVTVHVRQQRPGETHVSTREGITPVKPDDLIMRGVSGEEYPIGREIFERTYRIGEAYESGKRAVQTPPVEAAHDITEKGGAA